MKLEQILKFKNARPFEPFLVDTADGSVLEVDHPDAIAWPSNQNRIIVLTPKGGKWDVLDVMLVTRVGAMNLPAQP